MVWFEGSDLEATAYAIADNRTAEFAEWDQAALADLLQELRAEDSLEGVGFSGDDIDGLLAELEDGAARDVDDPGPGEPPAEPVSRLGDLWVLGDHRLLCGEAPSSMKLACPECQTTCPRHDPSTSTLADSTYVLLPTRDPEAPSRKVAFP